MKATGEKNATRTRALTSVEDAWSPLADHALLAGVVISLLVHGAAVTAVRSLRFFPEPVIPVELVDIRPEAPAPPSEPPAPEATRRSAPASRPAPPPPMPRTRSQPDARAAIASLPPSPVEPTPVAPRLAEPRPAPLPEVQRSVPAAPAVAASGDSIATVMRPDVVTHPGGALAFIGPSESSDEVASELGALERRDGGPRRPGGASAGTGAVARSIPPASGAIVDGPGTGSAASTTGASTRPAANSGAVGSESLPTVSRNDPVSSDLFGSGDDANARVIARSPLVPPRLKAEAQPKYPEWARRTGIEGTTLVKAKVLVDGTVGAAEVRRSAGNPELDKAAVDAIRHSRFVPAERGGTPVAVWIEIPIQFKLQH